MTLYKRVLTKSNIFSCIAILLSVFITSCKENTDGVLAAPEIESKREFEIDYKISFPDTVYVNKEYDGKIFYKSILDTVTTSFEDKEKERYTILYLKLLSNYVYDDFDFEKFKKTSKLKYGATNNREISFDKIKFDSIGTYYINGVIQDFVVIDLKEKNENDEDMVRLIEKQVEILHRVVVVDKSVQLNRNKKSKY